MGTTPTDSAPRATNELAELILRHAPRDGVFEAPWPGLTLFHRDHATDRGHVVYDPCVCFVAQGSKEAYLGDDTFGYDPLHYLALSVPLPLEACVTDACAAEPFLAMKLSIDPALVTELLLDAPTVVAEDVDAVTPLGIASSPMEPTLTDALVRLLRALDDPTERRVLAPLAVREVLFRVLCGEQGVHLRAVATRDSRAARIAKVLQHLQENYDQPLDVAAMAEVACVSSSTFHHDFKAVTASSPLAYLKRLRLHHARRLMLHDALSAAEAAYRVGYASPSQFSREFKRLFGAPPAREVERLRAAGQVPIVPVVDADPTRTT